MTGGWGTPRYWPEAPKVPDREQIAEQLGVNVEDIPAVGPEPAAVEATLTQDELSPDERITEPTEAPGPQTGAERAEVNPLYEYRGHLYWCRMMVHPGDLCDCGFWM